MLRNAFGLNQAGRLDEAARAAKGILKLQPKEPNALYLLGIVAHQQGARKDAARWFEKCRKADPKNVGAHSGLGIVRMDEGRYAEAVKCFDKVLVQMPDDAATLNNIGLAKQRLGETIQAIAFYERAVKANPQFATARLNLGKAHADLGNTAQDRQQYETGLRLAPNVAELHGHYADLLRFSGDHENALESYRAALRLDPDNLDINVNYAGALVALNRMDDAERILKTTMDRHPESPTPVLELAELAAADRVGGKERARSLHQSAVDLVARQGGDLTKSPQIAHRLGRAYDKLGRYDEAFACWASAHGTWKKAYAAGGVGYDAERHERNIDQTIAFFESRPAPPPHAYRAETRPIFVVGMMRSGTSLMEQILSAHSAIAGAGELMTMPSIVEELYAGGRHWTEGLRHAGAEDLEDLARRYLSETRERFGDAAHVVDKLPDNFLNVGLIRSLFPSAVIVHTRRNPMDTCLSIYMQKFSASIQFGHDLTEIAHYYRCYRRIMAFWHAWDPSLIAVDYEGLVADPRETTLTVLERLDLDWEDGQDRFYEAPRAVKTASALQVRQPIYTTAVERWRRYEQHLGPLIDALGDAAGGWEEPMTKDAQP